MAVIDNAFETKGTHAFFGEDDTPSADIIKFTCPTGITGVAGGSKDKIDTTCLDVVGDTRTSIGGFADASEVPIPFILYKGSLSHQRIFELKRLGTVVPWFIGLSDSDASPVDIDSDGALVPPTARTGFGFKGYVSNVTIDVATNEVVRGTLTVQPSGFTTPHWAA